MSTAITIIKRAYNHIGAHSEVMPIPASLLVDALPYLVSSMETLRKNDIVLEETVSGTTTTIAVPTTLTSELSEPSASTMHLIKYLAPELAEIARVETTPKVFAGKREAYNDLARMYRQITTENIVPSALLPRGQGATRGVLRSPFFDGNAIDDDASSTT